MSSYLYYPGCSLSGSARAYAESLTAILAPLPRWVPPVRPVDTS